MIRLQNFIKYSQLKPDLRTKYISLRRKFIFQEGPLHYSSIKLSWAALVTRLNIDKSAIIGSYIPIPGKQIIPPHLEGYKHAFPYFSAKATRNCMPKMQFKEDSSDNQYTSRVYGIKIPNKSKPTVTPSIVLVPLTCFHPLSKQRIGNGGGYYDQFIEANRSRQMKTIFVGVAYECLKQSSVFWEVNDQALDFVITERDIY